MLITSKVFDPEPWNLKRVLLKALSRSMQKIELLTDQGKFSSLKSTVYPVLLMLYSFFLFMPPSSFLKIGAPKKGTPIAIVAVPSPVRPCSIVLCTWKCVKDLLFTGVFFWITQNGVWSPLIHQERNAKFTCKNFTVASPASCLVCGKRRKSASGRLLSQRVKNGNRRPRQRWGQRRRIQRRWRQRRRQ